MPHQVGGEHADEHVCPDPGLGPVVDRAQVQVDGFEGPEVAFYPGQALVGRDDLGRVHLFGGHGGADDIEPVQGRLGGDLVLVAGEDERVVGDVQEVVLGHLVPADDLPDPDPDLAGTSQAPGSHGGDDLCQLDVRCVQQGQAFPCAFGGQGGVTAGDQAFPGVVGVGDLGEVGLVEQAHLQGSVVGGQGRYCGGT